MLLQSIIILLLLLLLFKYLCVPIQAPLQNPNFIWYEKRKGTYNCMLYKSNTRLPGTTHPPPRPHPKRTPAGTIICVRVG
jgi:hypothetical protein